MKYDIYGFYRMCVWVKIDIQRICKKVMNVWSFVINTNIIIKPWKTLSQNSDVFRK